MRYFLHVLVLTKSRLLPEKHHLSVPARLHIREVFLEAIDSLSILRREENISSWLYRIAHNKMVDFYRKKKIKSILLSQAPYLQIVANEISQPEFQFEKNKLR